MSLDENDMNDEPSPIVKPKRGRKPKVVVPFVDENGIVCQPPAPVVGKRGRKPKGGKVVTNTGIDFDNIQPKIKHNVILHIKCHTRDIDMGDSSLDGDAIGLFAGGGGGLAYNVIGEHQNTHNICENKNSDDTNGNNNSSNMNKIRTKLNELKKKLHLNATCPETSACFWCTCSFDTPQIYIPCEYTKDGYKVYGCFCSPECAAGYLTNQHIESAVLFERYQYLNHMYGKIFEYTTNIKPAPNPHYTLDKFCGNLSIREYRNLMAFNKLMLVVDKPLTAIFPEMHEDTDDLLLHKKIIPSNTISRDK